MFHFASAIFWFLVQPINLAILLLAACLVLGALRWRRLSLSAGFLSFIVLAVSTWTTAGALMLHPLEDRFAQPVPAPDHVDGIVVLGGGFEGSVNLARGGYELNSSGDRFVAAAALAHRYPDAKILISGGHSSIVLEGESDANSGSRMLTALGVDRSRLMLEGRSRDTYENAVYSKELAKPEPGQTWLLVTSAFHMPRSVAVFRAAGFPVVPWPTDYRTAGDETFGLAEDDPIDCLEKTSVAEREWIALLAYWLLGRTDTLLPSR